LSCVQTDKDSFSELPLSPDNHVSKSLISVYPFVSVSLLKA
jgi:hypothetical protein